jgi:hypothetical protein
MPLDEGFINSVPEEIRNEKSFQEIAKTDAATFAKNYVDSQKTLGRAILLPDEKDPDEKRAEKMSSVYAKLGRPETADKYDYSDVLKEGELAPEILGKWNERFHKAGLSTSQAKELVRAAMEESNSSLLTIEGLVKSVLEGDDKHEGWGENVEANIGAAKRALAQAGDLGSEMVELLEDPRFGQLGNHPTMVRFLHWVGSQFKEDVAPRLQSRGGSLDKEAAQAKIAEIESKSTGPNRHPYWDSTNPAHAAAKEEMRKLYKLVHGTEVVKTIEGK